MPAADLKKVKAAAAGRAKKSGRNWKLQYGVAVAVSVGSIALACIMMVINPDKGPFEVPVNDDGLISVINRNAKTWKARASSFFEGWTIGDVKSLEGTAVSQMGGAVPVCVVPESPVPDAFDAREKWPQCFNSPIYNMGNCTASWAITAATSLSNRYCISSPNEYSELMLSPQQLLSCDTSNKGCSGGNIDTVWNYIRSQGIVSEICFPYQADSSVSCTSKCSTESPMKSASHCVLNSEAMIMREIFLNGPVVAPIFLVDDFLTYKSGLYQEMPMAKQLTDSKRNRLLHAVKIVGWGSTEGKKYWIVENSWGEDWGESGYAKVIRGGEPEKRESIVIETYVLAGIPASKKVDDSDGSDFEEADMEMEDSSDDSDLE